MDGRLDQFQDVEEGVATAERIATGVREGTIVALKGRKKPVAAGPGLLVKVGALLGLNRESELAFERKKIDTFAEIAYRPDVLMDLSTKRLQTPVYEYAIEKIGCPVGTLPHYLCTNPRTGIDRTLLLREIEHQAQRGVSWMTLHLSPTKKLYERAQEIRGTPTTARGGGIVIEDMYINNRDESILSIEFNEILAIMKRYDVALSLGTTFRPANVLDALDEVHLAELELQWQYVDRARRAGVQVILEGIGHATLDKIAEFARIVRSKYSGPFMPLGPIPTDAAVGFDHVASAIGAAFLAYNGCADIINSVTREEHTGGIPDIASTLEGVKAARVAAHSVNIARFGDAPRRSDTDIVKKRAENYTCVVEGGLFTQSTQMRFEMGCARCGPACPLVVNHRHAA